MNIEKVKVETLIRENMMEYSAYVLLHRALADLRDGMKPVQRRILWSMFTNKDFKLTKSANVAGQVMKFHPHGSSYPTIVNMVQKDRHETPLIIGKGNFGQKTSKDIQPAADRYTEVKLSEIAIEMIKDYNKGTVKMIDNYDGTLKIPEVLPVKFPSILTYENSGIGVGFGCSIPSFNLVEVCNAVEKYILTGEKILLYPDFATGGSLIKSETSLNRVNFEGTGSFMLRGKATIDKNEIVITEIPYTTTREAIITKISERYKEGKFKEITNVIDLTGLKGLNITITAKKNADMQLLLEKLYKLTPLQTSYGANINVLDEGLPAQLGVWGIIPKWIDWRKEVIVNQLNNELVQGRKKLHLLYGLKAVLSDIDKTVDIIRFTPSALLISRLIDIFSISEEQADYVANMKLRNINEDYIKKEIKDIDTFEESLNELEKNIKNKKYINDLLIEGLKESVEKYGVSRKTILIDPESASKVDIKAVIDSTIEDYEAYVYITNDGYAYKFKEPQEELNLKPKDKVIKRYITNNKATVIVFDSEGNAIKLPVNDIPVTRKGNLGSFIKPLFKKYIPSEIINYALLDDKQKYLIMVYDNNRIAKIDIQTAYNNSRTILKKAWNLKQTLAEVYTLENDVILVITDDKGKQDVNTSELHVTAKKDATGVYTSNSRKLKRIRIKK